MKRNRTEVKTSRFGRSGLAVLVTLSLLISGITPLANAQSYTFTDLGTLGGTGSWAYDVNNNGLIAGRSSTTGDTSVRATLWSNGAISDLGTLAGYSSSIAFGINDAGQVVGRSIGSAGFSATLWSAGAITNMGLGNNSTANAINNSGQVVTTRFDSGAGQTATWSGGASTHVFQTSFLRPGINDAGQVVGESGNRAVLWNGGTTTVLSALPGSAFSYAYAINNSGQIVGDSVFCGACNDRATLWGADGTVTDLGTLGGTDSIAVDINAAGQIVGSGKTASGVYHATLWNAGAIVDLNSFLDASTVAAGWELYEANAINHSGWIVGGAVNSITGLSTAFLLVPAPLFPDPNAYVSGAFRLVHAALYPEPEVLASSAFFSMSSMMAPDASAMGSMAPIPEPEIYAMLAAGLGLMGFVARRRKQQVG